MSANVESFQKQVNPISLANLRPNPDWQPGKSANPGGQAKGTIHADAAYQRLGRLALKALKAYKPPNSVEGAIKKSLIAANEASDWKEANAALKQLILCLDGSPKQTSKLDVTVNIEVKREISITAYTLVYASKSREAAQAELDAIYDAKDEEGRRLAVIAAIEADEMAVAEVWGEAERLVMGEK